MVSDSAYTQNGGSAPSCPNYYDILGVPTDADEAAIAKAYKKLALKYHPDKNRRKPPEEAEIANEKFKSLAEAKDILCSKRALYDNYRQYVANNGMQIMLPGSQSFDDFTFIPPGINSLDEFEKLLEELMPGQFIRQQDEYGEYDDTNTEPEFSIRDGLLGMVGIFTAWYLWERFRPRTHELLARMDRSVWLEWWWETRPVALLISPLFCFAPPLAAGLPDWLSEYAVNELEIGSTVWF